jgi:steroid 5-alpha reductase family enzyme
MSKGRSLALVTLAYAAAIAAAAAWLAWGPHTGLPGGGSDATRGRALWLDTLIADVLATCVIFGFSRAYRNSSFYDAYWSVIPPLLLGYWWWQGPVGLTGPGALRCWLMAAVVGYWAVRLTGNWVYGFPGLHHEDWRYPLLREGAGRFAFLADLFGIHLFPTLQVFVGLLPAYVAATRPVAGWVWLAWLAFAVGIAAVTLELTADVQMHRFVAAKRRGSTGATVMDTGLWAWSRHPNYLGEIGFWLSLALFGISASPRDAWWLFVGVALMLAMFLGASIPLMEKRSLERRPQYQSVIDRVPMLLPRPPRKAAR